MRRVVGLTIAVVLSLAAMVVVSAATAGAEPDGGAWEVIPTPELDGQASLNAVTALSRNNAWAVGTVFEDNTVRTLTLHWDGTAWRRIPSPNRSSENWLVAVDASSPTDVWAVGRDVTDSGRHRTLVLHWDGTTWKIVPSPDPGAIGSLLNGVAVVGRDDVWVVGGSTVEWPLLGETLALHWNGQRWTREPTPNPSTQGVGSYLHSVDVSADGQVWAAGAVDEGDFVMGTMVLRRHRGRWAEVPTPDDPAGSLAGALTAPRQGQIWTVGWSQADDGTYRTRALHRRGARWSVSAVPTEPGESASLADVVVIGGHAWVFGSQGTGTLAARRTGRTWTIEPTPDPGEVANSLIAAAAIPRTRCLWAVGQLSNGDRGQPLIERYCASR